jgi:hypothetical protein
MPRGKIMSKPTPQQALEDLRGYLLSVFTARPQNWKHSAQTLNTEFFLQPLDASIKIEHAVEAFEFVIEQM